VSLNILTLCASEARWLQSSKVNISCQTAVTWLNIGDEKGVLCKFVGVAHTERFTHTDCVFRTLSLLFGTSNGLLQTYCCIANGNTDITLYTEDGRPAFDSRQRLGFFLRATAS